MGLLCCAELKNSQKLKEFEHQLSELGIVMQGLEQAKNKVHTYEQLYKSLKIFFSYYVRSCFA